MTTHTQDRTAANILAQAACVADMTEDELMAAKADAAREFTAYTLWPLKPREQQGDMDARAVALRKQRADAAQTLWLAAEAALDGLRS